jgi:hypothetical protein
MNQNLLLTLQPPDILNLESDIFSKNFCFTPQSYVKVSQCIRRIVPCLAVYNNAGFLVVRSNDEATDSVCVRSVVLSTEVRLKHILLTNDNYLDVEKSIKNAMIFNTLNMIDLQPYNSDFKYHGYIDDAATRSLLLVYSYEYNSFEKICVIGGFFDFAALSEIEKMFGVSAYSKVCLNYLKNLIKF